MNETSLTIPDMSCGHCVATVQTALEGVAGVESAEVSLETRVARVHHHGEMDLHRLLQAVEAVGFTPQPRR